MPIDFILIETPYGHTKAKTNWDHIIMRKKEGGADAPKNASAVLQAKYTERRGARFKCKHVGKK